VSLIYSHCIRGVDPELVKIISQNVLHLMLGHIIFNGN